MPPVAVGCIDSLRGIFSSSSSTTTPNSRTHSSAHTSSTSLSSGFSNGSSGINAPLAIVDMGSNGIRFGIIASLDRHLPVLYEERAPISLFEAQFANDDDVNDDSLFFNNGAGASSPSPKGKPSLHRVSTSRSAVPGSISNSATIAVMGGQEAEDYENEDQDADDDLLDDRDYQNDDTQAALRRTLVATEDNDITVVLNPAQGKNGLAKGLTATGSPPERRPISEKVIDEVVRTFERWQALCRQANVQTVRVIATEATRTAPNSQEFQARIKAATGWTVELLSKAQEANIGALGVMASYHTVEGLFMDLGGGSVQLNYIIRGATDGKGESSSHAQSWPYGAAALSKRLNFCGHDPEARQIIYDEMVSAFKNGLDDIEIAPLVRERNEREGGYRMYLSGGGFRALGYLLMAEKMKKKDGSRYPIPIINGYVATGKELAKIVQKYRHLAPQEVETAFRVSKRRAKLVPACATLMAAVMEVIPIKDVMFSEGGVRQGGCFGMLPTEIQNRDPALETVKSFVRAFGGGQPPLHESDLHTLSAFVSSALPADFGKCCLSPESTSSSAAPAIAPDNKDEGVEASKTKKKGIKSKGEDAGEGLSPKDAADLEVFIASLPRLIPILVLVMNCYNQLPKEARSTAAWQLFLPGGALANCYGLTHGDRAILATVLSQRHEGDLADPESGDAIKKLIPGGKIAKQACKYLGKILALAGLCSPLPGMATLLLAGGPSKHGGRIVFEQSPTDDNRRHRRDPDRTRVGEDPASENELEEEEEQGVVILQAARTPEGLTTHGQVVVRIEKGHPLLAAPNVQEAIDSLAQAAKKAHGFSGPAPHVQGEDIGYIGKGKDVIHA
ncbi:exopolyphosphatase / guanosine-5'-triphosphate,3'-diphosphate pyrophosphatase [Entomortierella parvispora]|uniref:Exopolyphosphatase / guanosine-5'-triphosphate,3'-diphosphate pyrophosphatase n=1 Tax=Entomortierella parvispora TaxID=205924 RepID=A0A9P3M2A3_9FUNG|nr:exopolyphosphatase / guanosine-5'-triphosphate,3'-diphosphate pyrophosphatase [Entomortierella parvispora]